MQYPNCRRAADYGTGAFRIALHRIVSLLCQQYELFESKLAVLRSCRTRNAGWSGCMSYRKSSFCVSAQKIIVKKRSVLHTKAFLWTSIWWQIGILTAGHCSRCGVTIQWRCILIQLQIIRCFLQRLWAGCAWQNGILWGNTASDQRLLGRHAKERCSYLLGRIWSKRAAGRAVRYVWG